MLLVEFEFTGDEQYFETSLSDKVKLRTRVSGSIDSLDHATWKMFLTPSTLNSMVKVIKSDVLRETRNRILSITPDNFYTKLNSAVTNDIKEKIRKLLLETVEFSFV